MKTNLPIVYDVNVLKGQRTNQFYKLTKNITGYKKCYIKKKRSRYSSWTPVIVKLLIPKGTVVYRGGYGRAPWKTDIKHRAEKAKVVGFRDPNSRKIVKISSYEEVHSSHNPRFKYKINQVKTPIKPFSWNDRQCDSGIHFFLSFEGAKDY